MPLSLVLYPDPKLRKVCSPVRRFDAALRELAEGMLQIMREKRGIGLAAPQVGVLQRLFVCNPTGEPGDAQVYVNPELSGLVGSVEADEGCLCLPSIYVPVRRAERCELRAFDLDGNPVERSAEGLLARIWQHENDHLDGCLILDRTTETAKMGVRKSLRELEERYHSQKPAKARAR